MKKVNLLSRAEMRKVMGGDDPSENEIGGGGCCCAHWPQYGVEMYACGKTQSAAIATANAAAVTYGSAHWCCTSCTIADPCTP